MARVAREMVERAGVNVDQLLDMLIRNASAELTTYYYYTILRVNLIGLEGEGLKEITEDARTEDRNHFEALVPRIYELGGQLPRSMIDFHNVSACCPAFVPADPTNIKDMLQILVDAERCAVRGYTEICNMTFGKDHRTTWRSRSCTRRSSTRCGSLNSSARDRAAMCSGNRETTLLMSVNSSAPDNSAAERTDGVASVPPRRYSRKQLARHDSSDPNLPVLIAYKGPRSALAPKSRLDHETPMPST